MRWCSAPRLRAVVRNTDGSALLETVIVLPVLALFMMVIMEMSLMANAKQLTNYAAFCAARTTSVYGLDSAANTRAHLAAALAMTSISPKTLSPGNKAAQVLRAFDVEDPDSVVQALLGIPGLPGDAELWLMRLAEAYVRTGEPDCDTATAAGKTRKHVVVNITYIYRCSVLPFGGVWGHSGLTAYIAYLRSLRFPIPTLIASLVTQMENEWRWNVPIRGRAVVDYWAVSP